jgi:O-antigen ligase
MVMASGRKLAIAKTNMVSTKLKHAFSPENILAFLPFLLFFPIGVNYAGVFAFIIAWLFAGHFRERFAVMRGNPIFLPVIVFSGLYLLMALRSNPDLPTFWSGLGHYQTYLLLLLFISIGKGRWQERAVKSLYAGALYGATVFYVAGLGLLPPVSPFTNYVIYSGNKSIFLGMLLAIVCGWLMFELIRRFRPWRFVGLLYLSGALLFVYRGRSGHIIFLLMVGILLLQLVRLSWKKSLMLALVLFVAALGIWNVADNVRARAQETIRDVATFSEKPVMNTSTTIRLQMVVGSLEMIREKPVLGHGVGSWTPMFQERYGARITEVATTPHNEYLLHLTEAGIVGMLALLWLWLNQLWIAVRIQGVQGARLGSVTAAMIVVALFAAIIRDATFALPFMVLLAIPLAGVTRNDLHARRAP